MNMFISKASDHDAVLVKIKIRGRCGYGMRRDKVKRRQVMASERLDRKRLERITRGRHVRD